MTVSVSISTSSMGAPVALPLVSEGNPGDTIGTDVYFISHNGTNEITDCGFYLLPYASGVYLGTKDPQTDLDEVLGWGDAATGGLFIDMNAAGSFPGGDEIAFKTGVGDSIENLIPLDVAAIITGPAVPGEIESGGEASIQLYITIPAGVIEAGTRYVTLVMAYTATS